MAENWHLRCPEHREHQISLFSGTMAVPVKNVLRNTEIAIMTLILVMFCKLHSELEWNGPSINVSLIAKPNNVISTDMRWFHFWNNNMTTLLTISGVLAMQPHIFNAHAISDVTGSYRILPDPTGCYRICSRILALRLLDKYSQIFSSCKNIL